MGATSRMTASRSTRAGGVALLGLAALLLGACGGGDDDDAGDIATLGEGDSATTGDDATGDTADGSVEGPTDPEEAALAFAQCMREHGIDMPDPEFTGDGGVAIGIRGDGSTEEEMQEAQEACQPLMENAVGNLEPPSAEELQERQDQALAAAQCMREHGYDWPDPEFDEGGGVGIRLPEGLDPEDPEFQAAQEECMGGDGVFSIAGGPADAEDAG